MTITREDRIAGLSLALTIFVVLTCLAALAYDCEKKVTAVTLLVFAGGMLRGVLSLRKGLNKGE